MNKKYSEMAMKLLSQFKSVDKGFLVTIPKNANEARINHVQTGYQRRVMQKIEQECAVYTLEDCKLLKNGEIIEPIGPYTNEQIEKLDKLLGMNKKWTLGLIADRAVKMVDGEWVLLDQESVNKKKEEFARIQENKAKRKARDEELDQTQLSSRQLHSKCHRVHERRSL
ncbi:hypothetical protein P4479_25400 [Brevibacillus agri]|uniref:hypothetical protein n=1 Tax=Brevibacillus agri TaxID=51101 RepID=UPI002870366B|nr:hypothetical protein [Brevibacillus agri]MDR9507689.1 hypothetical protein [Brevibacillus agri]MED3501755.1 hypothetical protein [Brevibacillus agri]